MDEFLLIYDTYTFKVQNPHIAIVDFLENAITEEFKIFSKLFAERGIECSVYDVRDLAYEDGRLIGRKAFYGRDNAPIDAIWRRSVTNDIIDNWKTGCAALNRSRACAQGGADRQLRGASGARQADLPGAVQTQDQGASDR